MEAARNTPAIILNRQSYRENDSLVIIYSLKYGQERLVARGTKKLQSKLAGHLEPISLADVMILKGKSGDYLGSAICRDAYLGIKADLHKLSYAGQALNRFSRLVKDREADEPLFFLLGTWLETIDAFSPVMFSKERGELLFAAFLWQFLAALGYQPELYHCQSCQKNILAGENYFDLKSGGLRCSACAIKEDGPRRGELVVVSDNLIKLSRFVLENTFSKVGKLQADREDIRLAFQLVNNFFRYHFA